MLDSITLATNTFYEFAAIIFLGLIFGSFATALVYRVPNKISWISGESDSDKKGNIRSACPVCGHKLGVLDLIPVFSWIILRGKCRYCKTPIPIIYPLTELTVLSACIGIYAVYGFSLVSFIMMVTMPFLVALLVIDLKRMILPNQLVGICFGLGMLSLLCAMIGGADMKLLLFNNIGGLLIFALFSWVLGAVVSKVLKKQALGFGDVKFFAVAGLWLGLENLAAFCILSGIFGVMIALLQKSFSLQKEQYFPFGPALIVSFYALLLTPNMSFF